MASRVATAALVAVLTAIGATGARGQEAALTLFARGGGYSALKSANPPGTAEFKTGFNLGGGIGLQLDENVELRVSVIGAQSQFRLDGAETGTYLNRYYFGADVKGQYTVAGGITPYGLVGGGAVLLHERGTSGVDKVQGFAHLGAGVARAIGTSGLSVFVQGDWLVYSLSQMSGGSFRAYSKTQSDVSWSVGASYQLAL